MNKEKIKEKVIRGGKVKHLSAQEYARLSNDEKKALREVIEEEGLDFDDSIREMEKLFPAAFTPKPLKWRNK